MDKKKQPTSGKPPESPFHLKEIHPSLSHPCFLLLSSKHPSPPWFGVNTESERRQLWISWYFSVGLPKLPPSARTESTRLRGAGLFLRLLLQSSTGAVGVNLPRAALWLAEPRWCWGRCLVAVQPAWVLEHEVTDSMRQRLLNWPGQEL